jgi:hypothetical protein
VVVKSFVCLNNIVDVSGPNLHRAPELTYGIREGLSLVEQTSFVIEMDECRARGAGAEQCGERGHTEYPRGEGRRGENIDPAIVSHSLLCHMSKRDTPGDTMGCSVPLDIIQLVLERDR